MSPANLPLLLTGAFITALGFSLGGTFLVRRWALRRGYVDHPGEDRRIHSIPTPNVGGVAIAVSCLASFLVWGGFVLPGSLRRPEILSMLVGGALIFVLGFWDDTHHLRARTKFIAQVLIASVVFLGGVRIMGVGFGDIWSSQLTGGLAFLVTVLWIVGTTNAFNLIDGSDGVAGGAALFASVSMGIIFALNGDPLGALVATILVGAALGFLYFNFPPASIFMGDSGSLFLGFMLASLAVITTQESSTLVAVTIPIVAFGIPLLDTVIAIVRRFLRHEPIFAPDRGHIHHRLADLGLSSRSVAVLLYVACAGCASLSMVLAAPGRPTVIPVFVVAGAVLILSVHRLNVPELTELTRVFGRGFQQRAVISHNVRVHAASSRMEDVNSLDEVVSELAAAFDGSEFSAIEIFAENHIASHFIDHDLARRDGSGIRLRVDYQRILRADQEYELRLPIFNNDQRIGRLSLYRRSSGHRLYTDVRLLAQRLAPALGRVLLRVGGTQVGVGSQARR